MENSNSAYDQPHLVESQTRNGLNPSTTNNNQKILKLNCESNFIFIAWTHYGHQTADSSRTNKNHRFSASVNQNSTEAGTNSGCYFSPKDCIVSVDYVANECNGLSSCQISLDAQYLHSCKAYSDYLFIIYECIEAKNTVNICENYANLDVSSDSERNSLIYLQSPFYPNEYMSNLDCNCSMQTSRDSSIQIELLEFDLESPSNENTNSQSSNAQNANQAQSMSLDSSNFNAFKLIGLETATSRSAAASFKVKSVSDWKSRNNGLVSLPQQTCSRDYFAINSNLQMCGSVSPFSGLLNVPSLTNSSSKMTSFRFYSDDALTRRGFWLKIKGKLLLKKKNFI